ncbi:Coiled-coil domain-containing protein 77 [Geranomyces variabilis]|nr:Coiled-coil domain-containing protein 77 [Geranomyces variabilis]
MDAELRKLPLSEDLLLYYRQRLERCEEEYAAATAQIDSIRISHEDVHRTQWEAHKRASEVAELQDRLSAAQVALFEEKKNVLRLLAEADELKVQELKDRKKIRYLLNLGLKPENETTYFRDKLDRRIVKVARDDTGDGAEHDAFNSLTPDADLEILSDEVEGLKLTVSSLRAQFADQARNHEATVAGLLRDRAAAADAERARREHQAEQIGHLQDKVAKLRALCRENIRELLHTKKSAQAHERTLIEDKSSLLSQLHDTTAQLEAEKTRADSAEKESERRILRKHDALAVELRQQLGKYERELHVTKTKYEGVEKTHAKKTGALEAKLASVTASYATLKRRRDLEIEGFTTDIATLRRQLKLLERGILKYAPLEDRELVLLKIAKETGDRVARMSSDLHGLKAKVYSADRELHKVPF